MSDTTTESHIRQRLGIPPEARQVLVFAESSHWDPNWLYTSTGYFERYVRGNLDMALEQLERQPRRVYSIECMFFLRMYWEACPENQERIRRLVNQGQLRLTSSGVTTADTLLPHTEAILRDFLLGQEWLRANGLAQEPRLAYFPDSFGCSPHLPSLLNAAGFDRTAFTRVDGMFFMGCDYDLPSRFQWPGSTAALLMKQKKTLDFYWRDNQGGQLLCHWNAYAYGQGDMLAYSGFARVYLVPYYRADPSEKRVASRIREYVKQLAPYSRTPYLFCPIGYDFNAPIPDLVELLERYNQHQYPQTGVWAVNAGLDDYLALVECQREKLPVLEFDPNPYWTGFYSARPSLKRLSHKLTDTLLLAECLALQPENSTLIAGPAPAGQDPLGLDEAWWSAAVANHHDFITGTGSDEVVEGEQVPMLQKALEQAQAAIAHLQANLPPPAEVRSAPLPEWQQGQGRLVVRTPFYTLELSEESGGCITRAWLPENQALLLEGPSNDLVSYRDGGGLWRMGHEFPGGTWRELGRASQKPARLEVSAGEDGLLVSCTVELDGMPLTRRLWLRADSPVLRGQVEGQALDGRTVTVRFATEIETQSLVMDQPGGVLRRPIEKKYRPTFWPLHSFFFVQAAAEGRGVAFLRGIPGAAAYRPGGAVELVAQRNANQEKAFGRVTFLGMPVNGHERRSSVIDYALLFTPSGDWLANRLAGASAALNVAYPERARFEVWAGRLVEIDPPAAQLLAIKPASRGEGWILRLWAPGQAGQRVRLRLRQGEVKKTCLCDARERDLRPLPVREGWVELELPGSLATVRLI